METEPRTWADGVPVFWTDSGRPRLTASLRFRQGVADETLQTSGWTHLVEHLALHDRDHGGLDVNGSTGLLETSLDVRGSAEAVAAALDSITSWLAQPELSRLPQEAMVLRAESQGRSTAGISEALGWRYGATGPGLHSMGELGLFNATLQPIDGWIRERFTAGNAVLVLDGPPPSGLTLRLPPGERRTVPAAVPLPLLYPSGYRGESADIVGSGVLPRSVATSVLAGIGERLLSDELRNQAAGAYAPGSFIQPVDNQNAVLGLHSDFSQELAGTIFHRWFAVLERLRSGQYDPNLITDLAGSARESARDPYVAFQKTLAHASRFLSGREAQSDDQWEQELGLVDQAAIGRLTEALLASQLLAVPPGVAVPGGLPMIERPSWRARSAKKYVSRPENPAMAGMNSSFLMINSEGMHLVVGDERPGQRFADLAGVLRYPDGGRVLIDRSGWSTRIEPTLWVRGRKAVQQLDQLLPPQLWIAAPERPTKQVPQARRMSNAARWVDLIVGLVVAAGVAALATPSSPVLGIVLGAIMVVAVVGFAVYWDRLPSLPGKH